MGSVQVQSMPLLSRKSETQVAGDVEQMSMIKGLTAGKHLQDKDWIGTSTTSPSLHWYMV